MTRLPLAWTVIPGVRVLPTIFTHPNVSAWYERLAARLPYQEHVIKVNAKRTREIAARG